MKRDLSYLHTPQVQKKRTKAIRAAIKRKRLEIKKPIPRKLRDIPLTRDHMKWVVDELKPHQVFERLLTLLESVWQSGR